MHTIKLLVVDDHSLFRRGLIALLTQDGRYRVAGQAGDMCEALRCCAGEVPDDPLPRHFLKRLDAAGVERAAEGWDGVETLTEK